MRSKSLFGLLVCSGLFALASASGCGDNGNQTSGAGASSGSSSSSSSSSSTAASSSSSGAMPDSNVDCESAEAINLGDPAFADSLDVANDDKDYFVFDGMAGDAIGVLTDSKPSSDEFDPTYPDLVITLKMKDASGAWVNIAQNDDPYPLPAATNDSLIYTKLPATGTYCVEVTECNTLFPGNCSPVDQIQTGDYTILAGKLNEMAMGIQGEMSTEPTDTAGTIEYENVQMGALYRDLAWGTFSDAKDVDMWALTTPAPKLDAGERTTCHFDFFYPGVDGNGSTAVKDVVAYMVDAAAPMTKIAQIDPNAYDTSSGRPTPPSIGVPCDPAKNYLFVMERGAAAMAGTNDFYFFNHYVASSNPLEVEPNDMMAMPEVLTAATGIMTGAAYYVDGDIGQTGDIDFYQITVPAMSTLMSIACESERGGSALRGFKVTALGPNDMAITGGKGNLLEGPTKDLYGYDIPIPTGATTLKVKVEATLPNAMTATSTYYRCGFHVYPPAMP